MAQRGKCLGYAINNSAVSYSVLHFFLYIRTLRPSSDVVLLPRLTKFINYMNVFWRDCVPTGS